MNVFTTHMPVQTGISLSFFLRLLRNGGSSHSVGHSLNIMKSIGEQIFIKGGSSTYFMFHLAFPSPELFMSYLSIHDMSWGVTVAQLVEW